MRVQRRRQRPGLGRSRLDLTAEVIQAFDAAGARRRAGGAGRAGRARGQQRRAAAPRRSGGAGATSRSPGAGRSILARARRT